MATDRDLDSNRGQRTRSRRSAAQMCSHSVPFLSQVEKEEKRGLLKCSPAHLSPLKKGGEGKALTILKIIKCPPPRPPPMPLAKGQQEGGLGLQLPAKHSPFPL